jgi:hypothetical protein
VRIIDHRFNVRRGLLVHHAVDRHIQPVGQACNVVGIRLARTVLDTRQRRCRNLRNVGNVPEAESQLFPSALDRPAELDRVYEIVLIFESHNLSPVLFVLKCHRCTSHFIDKT